MKLNRRTLLSSIGLSLGPAHAAQTLFDGRTLAGWHDPAKLKPAGDSWSVVDEAFEARREPNLLEDLVTVKAWLDFDLTFEWKLDPGGNSGIKYCLVQHHYFENTEPGWIHGRRVESRRFAPGTRGQVYIAALELQLIDDAAHPDALRGPDRRTGSLYGVLAPDQPARLRPGWNEGRLVRKADTVEHWINGYRLLQYQLSDPRVAARWQRSEKSKEDFRKAIAEPRPLALQNHGDSRAWFRRLNITA